MELTKVHKLCIEQMRKHGLIEKGWKFEWHNRKRGLGMARVRDGVKTILLSKFFMAQVDEEQILDTILHEVAHAITHEKFGRMTGHDARWKAVCREIGCKPERLAKTEIKHQYNYVIKYNGEVVCQYLRLPPKIKERLPRMYIPGRKAETLGQLRLFKLVRS